MNRYGSLHSIFYNKILMESLQKSENNHYLENNLELSSVLEALSIKSLQAPEGKAVKYNG